MCTTYNSNIRTVHCVWSFLSCSQCVQVFLGDYRPTDWPRFDRSSLREHDRCMHLPLCQIIYTLIKIIANQRHWKCQSFTCPAFSRPIFSCRNTLIVIFTPCIFSRDVMCCHSLQQTASVTVCPSLKCSRFMYYQKYHQQRVNLNISSLTDCIT